MESGGYGGGAAWAFYVALAFLAACKIG